MTDTGELDAPCVFCGYNGEGYWQSGTHATRCPWRNVGGADERRKVLRPVLQSLTAEVERLTWERDAETVRADSAEAERDAARSELARREWQPIETAPKERVGPASYENHGPKVLLLCKYGNGDATVDLATWDWHERRSGGNWKYTRGGYVVGGTPIAWQHPPSGAALPVTPHKSDASDA